MCTKNTAGDSLHYVRCCDITQMCFIDNSALSIVNFINGISVVLELILGRTNHGWRFCIGVEQGAEVNNLAIESP